MNMGHNSFSMYGFCRGGGEGNELGIADYADMGAMQRKAFAERWPAERRGRVGEPVAIWRLRALSRGN